MTASAVSLNPVWRAFRPGPAPGSRLELTSQSLTIVLIIYALQDVEATTCMRQLKWILQQNQVAAQEIVLIEQVPVHLIEVMELS
jgi:hypothetical protein